MTMARKTNDAAVAYHEAGHAVVARMLGHDVYSVSITSKRDSLGRTSWRNPINRRVRQMIEHGSEVDIDRVRHRIDHAVIVPMAGALAQKRHNPRSNWRYGGSGAQRGGLLLKGSDDQLALALLCRIHEVETVRDAYHRYLAARAQALVDQHWPRIERLAKALLQHNTIDGDDIVEFMRHPKSLED
jgi:hypothetical protein